MAAGEADPTVVEARESLMRWWCTGPIEHMNLDAITDEDYEQLEGGYQAMMEALCRTVGHEWVDDQCGRPEHQFCLYCRDIIPDELLDG